MSVDLTYKDEKWFITVYTFSMTKAEKMIKRILQLTKPAQQEAGPRSKRHPKSVEGLRVKGEGEQ